MPASSAERIAGVVGQVLRQAVGDAGAAGIVVFNDGSPEATLLTDWSRAALGEDAVFEQAGMSFYGFGEAFPVDPAAPWFNEELFRFGARLLARERRALVAHPANKTALLLGEVPPEPLLPLGDLYASQVQELAGGWSGPAWLRELAGRLGGIAAVDRVLERIVERREDPAAAASELGTLERAAILDALEAGRFARRRIGLVPKLGTRTLGIDFLA